MRIYRDLLARQIDQQSPHPFIDLSIILLTPLLIWLLAIFLLFWLGSATGHRSHTLTTTPFQYLENKGVQTGKNRYLEEACAQEAGGV